MPTESLLVLDLRHRDRRALLYGNNKDELLLLEGLGMT